MRVAPRINQSLSGWAGYNSLTAGVPVACSHISCVDTILGAGDPIVRWDTQAVFNADTTVTLFYVAFTGLLATPISAYCTLDTTNPPGNLTGLTMAFRCHSIDVAGVWDDDAYGGLEVVGLADAGALHTSAFWPGDARLYSR